MAEHISDLLLWLPAIIVGLTLHEGAHAWTADHLGDPTPRRLGRLSLNPLVHLDALGTVLLVLLHFGWGRPVPVDIRYLSRPRRDLLLIALAGPLANLLLALALGLFLRLDLLAPWQAAPTYRTILELLHIAVLLNLILAIFNLLPVPPLDGGKILASLLPPTWSKFYQRRSGWLSWGLLAALALGYFTRFDPLYMLLRLPSRWLYHLFTGSFALF